MFLKFFAVYYFFLRVLITKFVYNMNPVIDVLGFIGLFSIAYIIVSLIIKINKRLHFLKLDDKILKELEED
jgi:hypothetical protein